VGAALVQCVEAEGAVRFRTRFVTRRSRTLPPAIWDRLGAPAGASPAPRSRGLGALAAVAGRLRDLLLGPRGRFLLGISPTVNEETLPSITVSDVLIVVMRPDRQDYQGTAVTVEVARKLDVPRLFLVINNALAALDPEALRQQAEQAYQAPVAAILPLSEDVAELASGGLFCLRDPEHACSRAIERIAGQVTAAR
jgi:MinD-like ATPase involved in chromosome partitioning or flagellar assembly